jgi:hypothetical protein
MFHSVGGLALPTHFATLQNLQIPILAGDLELQQCLAVSLAVAHALPVILSDIDCMFNFWYRKM